MEIYLILLLLWLVGLFLARRVTSLATAAFIGWVTEWRPNTLGWLIIAAFLVLALIPSLKHRNEDDDGKGIDTGDVISNC